MATVFLWLINNVIKITNRLKMKKFSTLTLFLFLFLSPFVLAQRSEKITSVLEYMPAPGQHINRMFPTAAMSSSAEKALEFASGCLVDNNSMLGLGGYGGYVVLGFDHSIVNVPGEYDFKALGNAFANSAEPGIVMVCQDLNKNGKPDPEEPWYELAGSDYHKESTIHNYEVTYYRPDPDGQKSNIRWTDNQGGDGVVTHITFAPQATMYPLWFVENSITFKGTRLAGNGVQSGTMWNLPSLDWGYVDNHANNSSNDKIGFDIDWAIDDSGNPVRLEYIDFVKVYTGMLQEAGWLGETSTEISGIVDLHTDAVVANYPPIGEEYITLDLEHTITFESSPLAPNSHWSETYAENVYLESQNFIFSHRSGWGGYYWDGFTLSNHTDNSDFGSSNSGDWVDNQWGIMPKGGVDGQGANYLVGYWGGFNDGAAADVTETSNFVMFNDGQNYLATGVFVANSPWPYYGIKDGDSFARKFDQGDYFKLIATGYAQDGTTQTGTTEFYLADYRSVNPTQWKLNKDWQWMDLTDLGQVAYIQFSLESTDSGDYGMNTAALFGLDKLTVKKVGPTTVLPNSTEQLKAYRSGSRLYNLTIGSDILIVRLNGTIHYQGKVNATEMDLPSNDLFIIKISNNGTNQIIR